MSIEAPLQEGQILTGALFNGPMRVETVRANGPDTWAVGLVGTQSERFRKVTLSSQDLERLKILDVAAQNRNFRNRSRTRPDSSGTRSPRWPITTCRWTP